MRLITSTSRHICRLIAVVSMLTGVSQVANAALYDRGGGLLYDDVLNITWLQDANYAKTSGYATRLEDGRMYWQEANLWAANLVYHDDVRNVDYGDWRLARNTPVGANWNDNISYDGSTDWGFNITSPHSELAYQYYVNLGLKGYFSPDGTNRSDFGIFGNGTIKGDSALDSQSGAANGQKNVGPVINLQNFLYWSGSEFPTGSNGAWSFSTYDGGQYVERKDSGFFAWAVRDGDVASVTPSPVPLPTTLPLLLSGLGILGFASRRRKSSLLPK